MNTVWKVSTGSSDTGSPSVFLWLVAELLNCQLILISCQHFFLKKEFHWSSHFLLLFFLDRRNIFYFVSSLFRPQVFVMLGISGKHFRVVSCLDSEDEVTKEIINELETRQNSTNKLPSIFKSFKFHLYNASHALCCIEFSTTVVLIKLSRPYYSVFIEFLI